MLKTILKCVFGLIVVLVGIVLLLGYAPDTKQTEMEAKYGNKPVLRTQLSGIRYRDEGKPDGPVLLLLHGANSSLDTWGPMVSELADQFRLVRFDQHGHGMTGAHPSHDYSAQERVNAGVEVLKELNIERAIWVGNSMGGNIAWRAALLASDKVSGLVLLDASGAQTNEPVKPYIGAAVARTWIGQTILPVITPRFMVAKSLEQSVKDPAVMTDFLIDRYWELVRYPGNRQAMVASIQQGRETELWHSINSIDVPTLILWGEHDTVIPVSHASAFAERIADSQVIVYSDAGHLPMEEIPMRVAADVRAWFDASFEQPLSEIPAS